MTRRFTKKQGKYLAYIRDYVRLHGRAPAETDMVRYFRVTPPPVHQMVLTLEKRGLISRTPGAARSIRLLLPAEELPTYGAGTLPEDHETSTADVLAVRVGLRAVERLFEYMEAKSIDDVAIAPIIGCVADAVERGLVDHGMATEVATAARIRIVDFAVESYVRLRAENYVDPDDLAAGFRRLLARTRKRTSA